MSCSPSSLSNSGLKQYKDRYSTEPTDKQRSLSSIHSLLKWIKGQGHVAVVFDIPIKTYSLKVWFNCSTGINSFLPLHSLSNTHFLSLSFTKHTQLSLCFSSTPQPILLGQWVFCAFSYPHSPQTVLLYFGASGHRSHCSLTGQVSRMVAAIS